MTRFAQSHRHRRGAALMIALVCLVIVGALVGEVMRSLVTARRQSRFQRNELQALWLAEAGLSLGVARLGADSEYQGEVWRLGPLETGLSSRSGQCQGVVEIKIEPIAEFASQRRIIAIAHFPAESEQAMRCGREHIYQLRTGATP